MHIGKREVGPGHPTYIICEVASTHGNDWSVAQEYVSRATEAGADAVKFQLFTAETMIAPITSGLKATYEYFKSAETPRAWFPKLKALCDENGIDLLCTPFGIDEASFLKGIGVPAMKIASGELTNAPLLAHVATLELPVILSTGMATIEEVKDAVRIVRTNGATDIALLQSVSIYPTSFEDANVAAMNTLSRAFGVPVGYSDNGSKGMLVPLLAVVRGASIIEKHVTSRKERGTIDDTFSMSVEEFGEMVRRIRGIEDRDKDIVMKELRNEFGVDLDTALGDGIKRPAPYGTIKEYPGIAGSFVQTEADERHWARRGVYPARSIRKGERITADMLILLRPDVGISSLAYESIVGKKAGEDLAPRLPLMIKDEIVLRFKPTDIQEVYATDGRFAQTLARYWNFS